MRRQQHQRQGFRWWIIAVVVLVVAVGGFFVGKAMTGHTNEAETATNRSSKQSSKDSDISSTEGQSSAQSSSTSSRSQMMSSHSSMMQHSESSAKDSNHETTTTVGPYSVSTESMNAVGSFQYRGVNVPASLELSFNDKSGAGTATFTWRGGSDNTRDETYNVMYEEIPTTPIRVFSASNNAIRTVKVNTRIHIEGIKSGESSEINTAGDLYAFKNRDGGISIATPNYAGNVTPDEEDVLQEVVHR